MGVPTFLALPTFLAHVSGSQRHWLMRAKSALRHEVIRSLGEGDAWVRMPVSLQARRQHPQLPEFWGARLIICPSGRRYLTSLDDAVRYPADQVIASYRQRWEIELGFREIKRVGWGERSDAHP